MSKNDPIETHYRVYHAPGGVTAGIAQLPKHPSLRQLHAVIDPLLDHGELEHVTVLADFTGKGVLRVLDMFVDEDGMKKGLQRNEAATEHYRRACLMGRTPVPVPSDPETLDYVVGNAVLFDRKVWF